MRSSGALCPMRSLRVRPAFTWYAAGGEERQGLSSVSAAACDLTASARLGNSGTLYAAEVGSRIYTNPLALISSAINTVPPAAPRMVLCTSAT